MESPKLKEYFSKIIDEVEKKGHKPIVVRESFDAVAPRLVWQRGWLLIPIILAAMIIGTFLPALAILASAFLQGWLVYALTFLIVSMGGLLLYFSLSAFTFHEGRKLTATLLISLIVAGAASVMRWSVGQLISRTVGKIEDVASNIPFGNSLLQSSGLVKMISPELISTGALVAIILVAYNLWPIIFWISEKAQSRGEA